jgi:hypothetical protein
MRYCCWRLGLQFTCLVSGWAVHSML